MSTVLDQALGALLHFRLPEWHGLPSCLSTDIERIFGLPFSTDNANLGSYPALRETYTIPKYVAAGLIVYSRAHRVIVIETVKSPPLEVLDLLGQPDTRKPPEFTLSGYLVREYLYCSRGLVLSVAEALDPKIDPRLQIVRCRGIRALNAPEEYGAEYYLALQNSLVFE